MAVTAVKDEWRSGLMEHGELSVPPTSPLVLLLLCALHWTILQQKRSFSPMPLAEGDPLHFSPSGAGVMRGQFWIAPFPISPLFLLPVQEWSAHMVSGQYTLSSLHTHVILLLIDLYLNWCNFVHTDFYCYVLLWFLHAHVCWWLAVLYVAFCVYIAVLLIAEAV